MGLFEERIERIPELVRIKFRTLSDDDQNEIAQRVIEKLIGILSIPYIWTMVESFGNSYLREIGKYIELPPDPPAPPPGPPPKPLPFAVLLERLRLVYNNPEIAPHVALAFGYHTHLGYKPEEIALNQASTPLADLADSLLSRCADAAGDNADTAAKVLQPCFAQVLAIRGTSVGASTFQDHWKPEAVVKHWIDDVEEAVAAEGFPAACGKPPNRRLAFALGSAKGLGSSPARIVSEFGHLTLEKLQSEFEAIYRIKRPPGGIDPADWKPVAAVEGDSAKRQLMSYFTPTRTVGFWIGEVKRKLESAEKEQEKLGLRILFQFQQYTAGEIMAVIYSSKGFLGFTEAALPRDFAGKTLVGMEAELCPRYAKQWKFDAKAVNRWFRPLRDELNNNGTGTGQVLQAFPKAESVFDAKRKIFAVIRPKFQGGRQLPLFAGRHDLL